MTETTMRERVARAIAQATYGDFTMDTDWQEWAKEADAAIAAMRVPTTAMVEAGTKAVWDDALTGDYYAPDASELSRESCQDCMVAAWPAAIDAALSEKAS